MELKSKQPNRIQNELDHSFLRQVNITEREVYDFYRENRKKVAPAINQYNYYVKAVEGMMSILGEMIAQSEGGIYIEGLGYFACLKTERNYTKKRKSLLAKRLKFTCYLPYFFPDSSFSEWTMSGTFDSTIRVKIDHLKKYKLNFDICDSVKESQRLSRAILNNKYRRKELNFKEKLR